MKVTIQSNVQEALARFKGLEKQVGFAASRALNDTGQEVRKGIPPVLKQQLDKPTPFTASEGATYIQRATKDKLEAGVFFKDKQAEYMRLQIDGGVRPSLKRGGPRLPSAVQVDDFGNIPRGLIAKLKAVARKESKLGKVKSRRIRVSAKLELFYGDPKEAGGRKDMPLGIYKIVRLSAGRSQLVPLIVFPDTPLTYRKRVDLMPMANKVAQATFGPAFDKRLAEALATANQVG